jgi:hypothetical protein
LTTLRQSGIAGSITLEEVEADGAGDIVLVVPLSHADEAAEILGREGLLPDDDAPAVYDPDAAAQVAYDHLSSKLRNYVTRGDVARILDLCLRFQQKIGLVSDGPGTGGPAPELIETEMVEFIKSEAERNLRFFSHEVIEGVLAAEQIYLKQIGVIAS